MHEAERRLNYPHQFPWSIYKIYQNSWPTVWRLVTRCFNVFFDQRLIKRLSKQSSGWWLDTSLRPLWRHCNGILSIPVYSHTRGSAVFLVRPPLFTAYANKNPISLSKFQADKRGKIFKKFCLKDHKCKWSKTLCQILSFMINLSMFYATKTMEQWGPNHEYVALWRDITTFFSLVISQQLLD